MKKNDDKNKDNLKKLPNWCENCKYFGHYFGLNVCYHGSRLKVVLFGPKVVAYNKSCMNFVLKDTQKTR